MAEFKPGEIVDIEIKGARVVHETTFGRVVIASEDGTHHLMPPEAAVTRVAPAEWPPRPGDVWHNRDGDPFVHILSTYDHGDGDITEKPGLVAVFGGEFSTPEAVLADGSPLTLVHREAEVSDR